MSGIPLLHFFGPPSTNTGLLLFVLSLMALLRSGSFITMLTTSQEYVMDVGENLQISCEFESFDFNLFDNPVLWKKTQMHEVSLINLMSNIYTPFVTTSRFSVSFHQALPNYNLQLTIMELQAEDSGNYSCEVRGPQSRVKQEVTHYVYVRAPIKELHLSYTNESKFTGDKVLKYTEVEPGIMQCVSVGGFPRPELRVKLGDMDITDTLTLRHRVNMTGEHSMRRMMITTELSSYSSVSRAEYNGQLMTCEATVPGLPSNETTALISVTYSPRIHCQDLEVMVGRKNPHLTCEVRSNPSATSVFWVLDESGTQLIEPEVFDGFWTFSMIPGKPAGENLIIMKLFMKVATKAHFRTYTLVAENEAGMGRKQVRLIEIKPIVKNKPVHESIYGFVTTRDPISENRGYLHHSASAPASTPRSILALFSLACLTLALST